MESSLEHLAKVAPNNLEFDLSEYLMNVDGVIVPDWEKINPLRHMNPEADYLRPCFNSQEGEQHEKEKEKFERVIEKKKKESELHDSIIYGLMGKGILLRIGKIYSNKKGVPQLITTKGITPAFASEFQKKIYEKS